MLTLMKEEVIKVMSFKYEDMLALSIVQNTLAYKMGKLAGLAGYRFNGNMFDPDLCPKQHKNFEAGRVVGLFQKEGSEKNES